MSSAEKPALELRNVTKRFGDSLAVDDVTLTLEPGTFLTMLGPSGSGKTTTLNIIAGFLDADSGSVTLGGRDLTSLAPYKRDIGVVFQNYALFPHQTALQNVAFPLEMRGVSRREARVRAMGALEMVELGKRADRLPKQLSGGQQQRVALARAMVFEPDLLLMDEPLGALDKKLRETMQIEIMRLGRQTESTIVYVTHDQEEALVMSDQIAVYNEGRIVQLGTSEDLYERPRDLFVADFIGESVRLPCVREADGSLHGDGWSCSRAGQDFAEGRDAVLVVRPERMRLQAVGASGADARGGTDGAAGAVGAGVQGTVVEAIYVGNAVKYLISTSARQEIEVRVDRARPTDPIRPGDAVVVSWDPDDATVVSGPIPAPPTTSATSLVGSR
ncbi:ABC transporter ATP-binding protein [Herbiconiux sp. KACC 21604]|uniref:ABC transporter ATP-binding protein n=1 Tax=unclassified Herbiconiux TaxID=2618217 RepID=UPI0014927A28|nr:ABC transporter ATP-binding protein [Herbiconiux sp. SALV-R1]QJU55681.1 ABC transporter ATP-binding protein [Herbiconiux sp. SALV-R1]WPO86884.1 ABC transporter ATP-binding protein [Herbiconiux sp. KACC 21604]